MVTQNTAALVVTSTAALSLAGSLQPKLLKLFNPRVLKVLKTLVNKPKSGAPWDFTGKRLRQICDAVSCAYITKEEAIDHFLGLIESETDSDAKTELRHDLDTLQKLSPSTGHHVVLDGALLYILAKLSSVVCVSKQLTFDLCMEVDVAESSSVSSSSSSSTSSHTGVNLTSMKAPLVRPTDFTQVAALLNHFTVVVVNTGFCHISVLSAFLDVVLFEPVRSKSLEWPVAFECLILYLRKIEEFPDDFNVGNVVTKLGGMDAIRNEARSIASIHYSADIFRRLRGEPRVGGGDADDPNKKVFEGKIIGDNPNALLGCTAWNNGTSHLARNVDSDGRCKFRHRCCQFVSDKGKNGQCLGAHKRKDCDYDPAKKLSAPCKN